MGTQESAQNAAVSEEDAALRKMYLQQSEQRVRIQTLARDLQEVAETVRQAEEKGQCVMQAFPDSTMAQEYRVLAEKIEKLVISPNG